MEHEVVRLRFKSEALPLAIAKLNRAAFSRYELALIVWRLYESKMLNDGGVLIAEHHTKHNLPDLVSELRRWRVLKQGETSLSFYERS